jgi:hypothetical protein
VIQYRRVYSFTSAAWIRMMAASSTRSAYISNIATVLFRN